MFLYAVVLLHYLWLFILPYIIALWIPGLLVWQLDYYFGNITSCFWLYKFPIDSFVALVILIILSFAVQ